MDDARAGGPPAEPFFDEFRRLQPDVDVVLLPPEQPGDVPVTPAAEADRLAAVAVQVADDVIAACGLSVDFRFDRWEQVSEAAYEHLTRIRVDRATGGAALDDLIRVRDFLVAAGWRAKAMDTPVPWFVAETGEGLWRADVSLDGESLFVEVATAGLRLEVDPT
ncbi:hypothetical protein ASE12_02205 [Aeromicrobium sp. Root236]|uniref:hypothetical protein n=1 Tax=Aeromicrobium sp. Root236 TaxID=1736498 RepID=UPI0006FD5413|nr:hypothetical protein [Aeromicrobium sp. Root236]KRC63680.1 hypothetical protein ASE12_02205 [Aeromicrobium sp. Root236]